MHRFQNFDKLVTADGLARTFVPEHSKLDITFHNVEIPCYHCLWFLYRHKHLQEIKTDSKIEDLNKNHNMLDGAEITNDDSSSFAKFTDGCS